MIDVARTVPRVSLLTCTYNRRQYLPSALRCSVRQTWPNLQIIVVNDGGESVRDIVYVKHESFESRFTQQIATELETLNRPLLAGNRPYLLIGFGRWGSSDPWLGIPVNWGQIAGARVIVESTLPGMDKEPSQGAHFFHNIVSFQVCYLCVRHDAGPAIAGSS